MKSKSSTFILIVVILLVVGGLVYFFVIKGDSTSSSPTIGLVSTNTGKATGVAVASTGGGSTGDQVVSLLRNLSVIQLSDAIFQNPSFSMLQDISITLPPVTNQGRRNPFAVVSGDNAALPINNPGNSSTGTPAVINPSTGGSTTGTATSQ